MKEAEVIQNKRSLTGLPRYLAFMCGFSLAAITFYTAFQGMFLPLIQRSIHICLLLAVIFLWIPGSKRSPLHRPSALDYLFVVASLAVLAWTLYSHDRFLMRIPFFDESHTLDTVAAISIVILVLEAGRRTLGLVITGLAGSLILYAFIGPVMPAMFAHPGLTLKRFVDVIYLTDMGIWGALVGTSATLLFVFISFGVFLQATNTDKLYIDVSLAIAGAKRGGPAKVALLSSAAMGSISGSTIANVVTTGTMTIPLMKRSGYSPEEAGAIETVASAGGQILPPVMGTGAFIMADFLGVSYFDIVRVSFIPAILFYTSLWIFVDLKAAKKGLRGLSKNDIPLLKDTLKAGWYMFIPVFLLVILLIYGYTPYYAGAICTILIIILSLIKNSTRMSISKLLLSFEQCSRDMAKIVGIIACAAIIVAMINYTGLMIKSTSIILYISRGNLIGTLLLVGVIAYIMGMGLPIATCYVILATLGAPALVELGVPAIAAHLMIFWFAQLSTITPPVCMTAFAAAGIAGANPMKTGFTALAIGSNFYFIPMLFIFSDILHVNISIYQALLTFGLALLAIYCFAGGVEGNIFRIKTLTPASRITLLFTATVFFACTFNSIAILYKVILFIAGSILFSIACILSYSK
jgi:TRAP transporter 4TM/12TM fusion protein